MGIAAALENAERRQPEGRGVRGKTEVVHPEGFEPSSASSMQGNDLSNTVMEAGAESGAVPADSMLATLVAMLTPEQKAAFVSMLTTPAKAGG